MKLDLSSPPAVDTVVILTKDIDVLWRKEAFHVTGEKEKAIGASNNDTTPKYWIRRKIPLDKKRDISSSQSKSSEMSNTTMKMDATCQQSMRMPSAFVSFCTTRKTDR